MSSRMDGAYSSGYDVLALSCMAAVLHLVLLSVFGFSIRLAPIDIVFAGFLASMGLLLKGHEQRQSHEGLAAVSAQILLAVPSRYRKTVATAVGEATGNARLKRTQPWIILFAMLVQLVGYAVAAALLRGVSDDPEGWDVVRLFLSLTAALALGPFPAWLIVAGKFQ